MSLCNDIYSKSIKQEKELNSICNDVLNGAHDKVLNKIKDKFNEKLVNFENSISVLEKQIINEYSTYSSNYNIWMKKLENLKLSLSALPNTMNKNIQIQTKKITQNAFQSYDYNDSNSIAYLTSEHDSLKNSLRMSRDIENQELILIGELDSQQSTLNSVKNKVLTLYAKVDFMNTITQWLVRRGVTDKQIFLGLVLLTILVTYLTYYYVKPWLKSFVV